MKNNKVICIEANDLFTHNILISLNSLEISSSTELHRLEHLSIMSFGYHIYNFNFKVKKKLSLDFSYNQSFEKL